MNVPEEVIDTLLNIVYLLNRFKAIAQVSVAKD